MPNDDHIEYQGERGGGDLNMATFDDFNYFESIHKERIISICVFILCTIVCICIYRTKACKR